MSLLIHWISSYAELASYGLIKAMNRGEDAVTRAGKHDTVVQVLVGIDFLYNIKGIESETADRRESKPVFVYRIIAAVLFVCLSLEVSTFQKSDLGHCNAQDSGTLITSARVTENYHFPHSPLSPCTLSTMRCPSYPATATALYSSQLLLQL